MIRNLAFQEIWHVNLSFDRSGEQVGALEDLWAETKDIVDE